MQQMMYYITPPKIHIQPLCDCYHINICDCYHINNVFVTKTANKKHTRSRKFKPTKTIEQGLKIICVPSTNFSHTQNGKGLYPVLFETNLKLAPKAIKSQLYHYHTSMPISHEGSYFMSLLWQKCYYENIYWHQHHSKLFATE